MSGQQAIKHTRRNEAEWRALLWSFEHSTPSAAVFCRREGICAATLYRWRRLHAGIGTEAVRESDGKGSSFVDLGLLADAARLELKLDLGRGAVPHLVRG